MEIRIVTPAIGRELPKAIEREFAAAARGGTHLSHAWLDRGPASIESAYDSALAMPDLLLQVQKAQVDGVDAIIINCASDPGLDAARELASIPVVGVAQAAFSLAAVLAQKFSVMAILERDIPDLDRLFRLYGVHDRVASVRVIDTPVLELTGQRERVVHALTDAALLALREDGAEAITFDCTGLSGMIGEVGSNLSAAGFRVPVIDPVAAAVKLAESLVELGLAHSKLTWPDPPDKEVVYP